MNSTKGFHVSEYIEDELQARGWTRAELAVRMAGENATDDGVQITALALDLLMACKHDTRVRLGKQAEQLAAAFGTSAETWRKLHESWLMANGVEPTRTNTG